MLEDPARYFRVVAFDHDESFDDLTHLAAKFCGTPIAIISFANQNRFHIKSIVGAELPKVVCEHPPCSLVVKQRNVFIVHDALSDVRFVNHPFVTSEPHIRFYAGVPLIATSGIPVGVLCVVDRASRDLNDSQKQILQILARQVVTQLELRSLSVQDPLTGLSNRRFLFEVLEREINRMARKQQSLGLILLDIDHFKHVNDKFGHEAGDMLLKIFARRLQTCARREDVACRLGGEEFILVLPETPLATTLARANELLKAVRGLNFRFKGQPIGKITTSAGIAHYPEHATNSMALLQKADNALYRAKAAGRDQIIVA
jgi:diguanylate cyclase (GGDEF)-like protein